MRLELAAMLAGIVAAFGVASPAVSAAGDAATEIPARLARLEAQVTAAEDLAAVKRLQKAYGYYLDKGMWEDLAAFFTEDAVANYPAGVYVGQASIRKHLFLNVGGRNGAIGLGDNRLYNHMSLQPVVHLDPDGRTAKGRWRVLAMFGSHGGGATWAEGVYEMEYAKVGGVWKIRRLDYYSGFAAPYDKGWVAPEPASSQTPRARRTLPHPPDRERRMECEGFPAACLTPFHYQNPGTSVEAARAWTTSAVSPSAKISGNAARRVADLAHRADRLRSEQQVENLQRIYGYYVDRAMWDHAADLFAEDGTIEVALQGVYVGRKRVREFLGTLGPHGLEPGWLNEHIQLQPLVHVSADGRSARIRSRELAMLGKVGGQGLWREGLYENEFVREDGVWKIRSLRYYPTFITAYEKGWAKDAQPAPAVSTTLPPDRAPSNVYAIYPKAHVPPFHYRNPVTGRAPTYPTEADGGPGKALAASSLMADRRYTPPAAKSVEETLAQAERTIAQVKAHHEIENLQSAYGYYLDKNLWTDLANLFARDGSIELAQRGVYRGPRLREFLVKVFGRGQEGPVAGRLGNHIQVQPVIHLSEDGSRARVRSRMLQQMSLGSRASLGGAIYENEVVKEDGVWKFSVVHAFNTFSAPYEGGWTKVTTANVPGPSKDFPPDAPPSFAFSMFPAVYNIPFHYANPVSGRAEFPPIRGSIRLAQASAGEAGQGTTHRVPPGMPPHVAQGLREIGPRIEGRKTSELYAPLHAKEPYEGVRIARDLSYGPHERHVLDVFASPDTTSSSRKPVVVFVHGGGFTGGSKRGPNSPFYDNVGLWAARHGLVGITINYRLAPEFQFPSGVEDLTRLVAWLKGNVGQHGGDANRLFFWGHSAGAAHVADYIAHVTNAGRTPGIAGAILTSGFYELGNEVSVWKAYYGEDVSKYAERSSLQGLVKSHVPLLVTDAELDPDTFRPDSDTLAQARAAVGRPVTRLTLPAHSHLSELYAVNTEDESLSGPVLKFIQAHGATR